jgi:hypothetical protein
MRLGSVGVKRIFERSCRAQAEVDELTRTRKPMRDNDVARGLGFEPR